MFNTVLASPSERCRGEWGGKRKRKGGGGKSGKEGKRVHIYTLIFLEKTIHRDSG